MFTDSPSEELRKKLLAEELKLRKKQPEHWAKTKYRKYAKPFTPEELERIKEYDRKRRGNAPAVKGNKKAALKSRGKSKKAAKSRAKKTAGKKSGKRAKRKK
ncbi:MAG TPA: hypothetical protein VFF09_00920 [archaeon]|nr:hypothetical protein [archaeon]